MEHLAKKLSLVLLCVLPLVVFADELDPADNFDAGAPTSPLPSGFVDTTDGTLDGDDGTLVVIVKNPSNVTTGGVITVTITDVPYTLPKNPSNLGNIPVSIQGLSQASSSTPSSFEKAQAILQGLDVKLKLDKNSVLSLAGTKNNVAALMVPVLVNKAVIEKTVALGIPGGVYISPNPFAPGSNTLTAESIKFFNGITLNNADLAIVLGQSDKAKPVAAQLVANGANSNQILFVPDARLDSSNTVAVYVIRLPLMQDLFTQPAQS